MPRAGGEIFAAAADILAGRGFQLRIAESFACERQTCGWSVPFRILPLP